MQRENRLISCVLAAAFALQARSFLAAEKLTDLIPDDAVATLYVERPQRALPPKLLEPFSEAITDNKEQAALFVEVIKRVPGPMLIGLFAPEKDESDFFIVMGFNGPDVDLDALMEKSFLPFVEMTLRSEGSPPLKIEKGKIDTRIIGSGKEPIFAYAVKGQIAFGSTKIQLPARWSQGEWPQRRWVEEPGVRRLIGGLPREFSARVFFNPLPLIKRLGKPAPNSFDELAMKIFAPEDIQGVALDLTWSAEVLSVRVAAALADECRGFVSMLARPTTPARVLGVFPEDFVALGRIGWGSAADLVEGAYAISDRFDKSISAEYREELAEFKKETGVDWDKGILGNLAGELAFGVRVDFTRKNPIGWAVVFPLGDEAGFREQFDKLIAHFDLQFDDTEKDGVLVRKTRVAKGGAFPGVQLPPVATILSDGFHLAIEHGLLITGSDAEIVVDVVKQAATGKTAQPAGANLRACYAALGDPNQMAVMLDIEQLRNKAPIVPVAAGPLMGPLLMQGFAGVSMTVHERIARLDLLWSMRSTPGKRQEDKTAASTPADAEYALATLIKTVGASLAQARKQAQQTLSEATMRNMGQALQMYAQEHKGAFPGDLEELLRGAPEVLTLRQFTSPYNGKGPKSIDEVNRKAYVVYRPGLTPTSPGGEVILAERDSHDGGAVFLFVDGHVEFVPEPRATELMKTITGGSQ
jgi:prepilin-type processing-associated H-X9-DG protein